MKTFAKMTFQNELGNTIEMSVNDGAEGVVVFARGPTSQVLHTWTTLEAMWLRDLLTELFE